MKTGKKRQKKAGIGRTRTCNVILKILPGGTLDPRHLMAQKFVSRIQGSNSMTQRDICAVLWASDSSGLPAL